MIGEAIDTLITLGWAFTAWIVLTAAAATGALYAVVAAGWWIGRTVYRLAGARRALDAPVAGEDPESGARLPRTRERRSGGRVWRRSARVSRGAPTAAAPSRPHSRRCGVPQGAPGGFPAPPHPRPAESRTALSLANIQPINEEIA